MFAALFAFPDPDCVCVVWNDCVVLAAVLSPLQHSTDATTEVSTHQYIIKHRKHVYFHTHDAVKLSVSCDSYYPFSSLMLVSFLVLPMH